MTRKPLGDALPDEIARVSEIFGHYQQMGPTGAFGVMMVKASLERATRALATGDIGAMLVSMNDLKEYSE